MSCAVQGELLRSCAIGTIEIVEVLRLGRYLDMTCCRVQDKEKKIYSWGRVRPFFKHGGLGAFVTWCEGFYDRGRGSVVQFRVCRLPAIE